jgi:hypothetical protein
LKFLFTFAPKWLFLYPGYALAFVGAVTLAWLLPGAQSIGQVEFGVHTLLFAAGACLLGLQLMCFAIVARVFGIREGYWPGSPLVEHAQQMLSIDRGCLIGGASLITSLGLAGLAVANWAGSDFGSINPAQMMRYAIPSVLLGSAGMQIMFTSFLLGLMQQPRAQ